MSAGCDVPNVYGTERCVKKPTHAVVATDGTLVGLVCGYHATQSYGERDFDAYLHGVRENRTRFDAEVRLVSLFCDSCKQRLPMDNYPGPLCPECMRVVMVTTATREQTAAIVALRETMVRIEKRAMAMETKTQKDDGIIGRASAVASAVGANDMAMRAAARQIRKLAKAPLVAGLKARLGVKNPREFTRAVTAFLNSDLGDAALSVALGGIIRYAPFVPEGLRDNLSRELVIDGGAAVLDFAADIVMGPVREVLAGASSILADPNVAAALRDGGIKVDSVVTEASEKVGA